MRFQKIISVAFFSMSMCLLAVPLQAQPISNSTSGVVAAGTSKVASPTYQCLNEPNAQFTGTVSAFPKSGTYYQAADGSIKLRPYRTKCVEDFGFYQYGMRAGENNGQLRGKYVSTDLLSFPDLFGGSLEIIHPINRANNNFEVAPLPANPTPLEARRHALWLSQTNAYYHIDQYFRTKLKSLVPQLGLGSDVIDTIVVDAGGMTNEIHVTREFAFLDLGYRSNLVGLNQFITGPALHLVTENASLTSFSLDPFENLQTAPTLVLDGNFEGEDPISASFDSGLTVGEYVGLRAFALLNTNQGFPSEFGFGDNWSAGNQDISPILNDTLNLWVAYHYTGQKEATRDFWYGLRKWKQLLDGTSVCDLPGKPKCFSGLSVDNVMMYDRYITDRDNIFPPREPDNYSFPQGPVNGDFASIYLGSLFYEFSLFMGVNNATLLLLKTISLIGSEHIGDLSMVELANLILVAADDLFAQPNGPNLYDKMIKIQMVNKGIPYGASTDLSDYLPEAIGSYPDTLLKNSSNKFGSRIPESHPTVDNAFMGPGSSNHFSNTYTHPEEQGLENVAIQFWNGSRYGPCDYLHVSDGYFRDVVNGGQSYVELVTSPQDADYLPITFDFKLKDRDFSNLVLIVPGRRVSWNRYREKCASFEDGNYTNDVRPPGFRAIKATTNGFSFSTQVVSSTGYSIRYQFDIVDPSGASQNAVYNWELKDSNGQVISPISSTNFGRVVEYQLIKNRIVDIQVTRTIGGVVDTLEMTEATSGLNRGTTSRSQGNAFVLDCVSNPQSCLQP